MKTKQSLGLCSKLVKALQCLYTLFLTLDFITLAINLSQSFRIRKGTYHGDLFPAFSKEIRSHQAPSVSMTS